MGILLLTEAKGSKNNLYFGIMIMNTIDAVLDFQNSIRVFFLGFSVL